MKILRAPFVFVVGLMFCSASIGQTPELFTTNQLDHALLSSASIKNEGDINGNGLTDLVVAGLPIEEPSTWESIKIKLGMEPAPKGNLMWLENPNWKAHPITTDYNIGADFDVADVDKDGKNDLVLLTDQGVLWLKNPTWEPSALIDTKTYHDLATRDLDNDGDLDIVLRGRSRDGDNEVVIYYQEGADTWKPVTLDTPLGTGLAVKDMNNDGLADILVNDIGLINPGDQSNQDKSWSRFTYTHQWDWAEVAIDTADFNQDGRIDVLLGPEDSAGEHYQLAWFEAPELLNEAWTKHVIDQRVEAVLHFVAARDIDLDHQVDVITAQSSQGKDTGSVSAYLSNDEGDWTRQVLSHSGGHGVRAFDVDLDVDIDLFGAAEARGSSQEDAYAVTLWSNQATENSEHKRWKRIDIGSSLPSRALLMFVADFNGDQNPDVATAGHWFEHSGDDITQWTRHPLPEKARNVVWVGDIDKDGDIDMLASEWSGRLVLPTLMDRILNRFNIRDFDYKAGFYGERFNWGENDGKGNFTWHYNLPDASGDRDFLQGAVDIQTSTGTQIVLSWHDFRFPLEAYEIPKDPVNDPWKLVKLSDTTQGEEITHFDVDQDGLKDLVLGTKWMKNTGSSWEPKTLVDTDILPDRNVIADIDGDGNDDVVIGYEIVNIPGKLAWYGRQSDGSWKENIISLDFLIGTSSVDVADVDMDSDMDVFVGEHNTKNEERARVYWFENVNGDGSQWKAHLIYRGDEHHNGTRAVDLDKDGDMDLVSIGFRHDKVSAYINPTIP